MIVINYILFPIVIVIISRKIVLILAALALLTGIAAGRRDVISTNFSICKATLLTYLIQEGIQRRKKEWYLFNWN